MLTRSPSRLGRLLSIAIAFFIIGFLGLSYILGLAYCDDRTQLAGNHPAYARAAAVTGNLNPGAVLDLQIHFAIRHEAALDKLVGQQNTPGSANFHKWLKTGAFAKRFGPTKPEVTAVSEWLRDEGFEVKGVSPSYLEFRGSVAQTQHTFAVRIAKFGVGNAFANTSDPFVPTRFASAIGAVTGMDNMVTAVPVSQDANAAAVDPNAVMGSAQAFGPNDLQTFYDDNPVPGHDGAGDCLAIVGTSDFLDSTMSAYTTQFGLAPIDYTRALHGVNPGINGAEIEAELDLQWAHAAAPAAPITFHLGANLVDNISGAVNDNQCGAISISYGFCGASSAFITAIIHPLFQQAVAQGQSVFISSGDQGSAGLGNSCAVNNSQAVNEMAADPNVTSVGGTQFTPKFAGGSVQGASSESAWDDGSGASGGGASQIFPKPAYQTGPGVPQDGARDLPDVSMMASPNAPGAFVGHDVNGHAQVVCCIGGTSLSAPLWAAFSRIVAEVAGQTRLGNLNTIIYQLANQQYGKSGLRDVTAGNNSFNGVAGFNSGSGYDQATGWGTVDFDVFADAVRNLLNPSPSPTPTATATPSATATPTGGVLSVPAALNFPATATGRPGTIKTLTIRNLSRTATLLVDIGALAAPFTVSGAGHYTLAPGSSIPIAILLSPTQCGTMRAPLEIASSDPSHRSMVVNLVAKVGGGKLSAPAQVSLNAPVTGLGTRTVMLKNSGKGMLSGTAQAFGPDSPFALLGGSVPFWLSPGQTQAVTIQFKATAPGKVEGNLVIAMMEPSGSTSISVSGTAK